ncbi:MAG: hypothetical protein RLZZ211_1267 [Bacteroidota bacterium]
MSSQQQLIDALGLLPHPEGGFYKETYRSERSLEGEERNLLTSIYFLLTSENVSRFHRIKSDELWYFHAGSPLIVHTLSEATCNTTSGSIYQKASNPFSGFQKTPFSAASF